MARLLIAPVVLVKNVWHTLTSLPTAITSTEVTSGVYIDAGLSERLMLKVTQTNGTAHDIIIRSIYGTADDYTTEIPATVGDQIIMFETARFEVQTAGATIGQILIDFETGFVGTLMVIKTLK
jgi:hypothetical protein